MTAAPAVIEPSRLGAEWTAGTLFYVSERLQVLYGMDLQPRDLPGLLQWVTDYVNRLEGKSQPLVNPLRQLLRCAVEGPTEPGDPELVSPSDRSLENLRQCLSAVRWQQSLDRTPTGGVALHHHAFVEENLGFIGLVHALLTDKSNRDLIGRCRYQPCGKFFVIAEQPFGRPMERYCGPKHRKAQNALEAGQRQLAARARRKLEQRYGRDRSSDAVRQAMQAHPEERTAERLAEYARALLQDARKHK